MFLMQADPLRGQVGWGWALKNEFLGPVKWHRADMQVPFGAQNTWDPLAQVMDLHASKIITHI